MNMHYIYILILYVYGLFGPFTASHSSLAISVIASIMSTSPAVRIVMHTAIAWRVQETSERLSCLTSKGLVACLCSLGITKYTDGSAATGVSTAGVASPCAGSGAGVWRVSESTKKFL